MEEDSSRGSASSSSYQIAPPEEFDFTDPEIWSKWIRRFERFRTASGPNNRDQETQVNTLLYTMGEKSDDILSTFCLSQEEATKYNVVKSQIKSKFDNYFVKRRNTVFERAKFNSRKQESGESVDAFITDLYCLAKHCNYVSLHDEMIRDRIIVEFTPFRGTANGGRPNFRESCEFCQTE